MKELLDRELAVGDVVAYKGTGRYSRGLDLGTISSLTKNGGVSIKRLRDGVYVTITRDAVLKIDEHTHTLIPEPVEREKRKHQKRVSVYECGHYIEWTDRDALEKNWTRDAYWLDVKVLNRNITYLEFSKRDD